MLVMEKNRVAGVQDKRTLASIRKVIRVLEQQREDLDRQIPERIQGSSSTRRRRKRRGRLRLQARMRTTVVVFEVPLRRQMPAFAKLVNRSASSSSSRRRK
jgi:hypothetical protein